MSEREQRTARLAALGERIRGLSAAVDMAPGAIHSIGIDPDEGYQMYAVAQNLTGADDIEAHPAFLAGYELARSQSTQGSGTWNPRERH